MNDFKFIPDNDHFQKIRLNTIGASDIPIILGLIKNKTPFDLWQEKTGRVEPWQGNAATELGHKHELTILSRYIEEVKDKDTAWLFERDYIINKFERHQGYKPSTQFYPYTEFIHPDLPFAIAHPDCIDTEHDTNIESKSGNRYANIRRNNLDGYDADDPQGYPLKVYFQIQWQMLCSGIKETVLRALIDTNTELSYNIQANKKIQEKLIEISSRFMFHVKQNKAPLPTSFSDIKKMFPDVKERTAYVLGAESEFAVKAIERKEFLQNKSKRFKEEIDDINDSLALLIGENKYLYDQENNKLCSQVIFDKEYINLKELEKNHNEIYEKLKKEKIIYSSETRFIR